jgi:hypothetical protein
MAVPLFVGNTIAILWDFDQTLIPGYQQDPLFQEFDVDRDRFWRESSGLVDYYKETASLQVSEGTAYLNHLLTYVREGKFPGLNNAKLRELGGRLGFYPGLPDFLAACRNIVSVEKYVAHGIHVEHYVVSTGLRQVILGSKVAEFVTGVWACEFLESPAPPGYLEPGYEAQRLEGERPVITQVAYFLDDTTKTRAVWEINKGVNIEPGKIGVNDFIAQEDRRVPIPNMIYVADGPTDVPIFSILNQYGGRTLGVYNPEQDAHFLGAKRLREQGRVQEVVEADYRPGTTAYRWITTWIQEIGDMIVENRERAMKDRVHAPGGHVTG